MTSRKWRLYLLPVVGWSKVCARGCVTQESEITQPRGHFYEHHYTAAIINVCSVCKLASICLLFALCYVPCLLPSRIAISGYCGRIIMSAVWRNATARAAAAAADKAAVITVTRRSASFARCRVLRRLRKRGVRCAPGRV